MVALGSMVTRRARSGRVVGASQRIGVRDALRVYTEGSARASGEQDSKGRLSVGMLADFAVLDADPFLVAAEELEAIEVVSTWVGGSCVWSRDAR
jgi:predicted amidohydrolase YtcJ